MAELLELDTARCPDLTAGMVDRVVAEWGELFDQVAGWRG